LYAGNDYFARPYGFMPHPNILAGLMIVGILAASTWLLAARRWLRWGATILVPLGFGALLLTFSRSAWIGLVAGGIAILPLLRHDLRRRETRLHLGITIGLMIAVGVIFMLTYRPFLAARSGTSIESVELRSVSDRLVFMDFAFQSITERTLLGVGVGNFPWRTSYYIAETFYDLRGDNVHHVTLSAWAELGLVGYTLVVVALVSGIETALQRIKSMRGNHHAERAARTGLLGVVLAFVTIGLFDHYPWTLLHFQVVWWGSLALAGIPIQKVMSNEQ
jgi:putative inorganic carbon (HCO3(-)) transporter